MALFSKKSRTQKSVQEDVLDCYTRDVAVWLAALSNGPTWADTIAGAGDAPILRSDLITNAVSRDLCIVTARKWVDMELAKYARRDVVDGRDRASYWDEVFRYLTEALPRTTTL